MEFPSDGLVMTTSQLSSNSFETVDSPWSMCKERLRAAARSNCAGAQASRYNKHVKSIGPEQIVNLEKEKRKDLTCFYLSRRMSSTLFPSQVYVWWQTSDKTYNCNHKSRRLRFVRDAMLQPTQLCQYKFQSPPRERGTSWMRVKQRHS